MALIWCHHWLMKKCGSFFPRQFFPFFKAAGGKILRRANYTLIYFWCGSVLYRHVRWGKSWEGNPTFAFVTHIKGRNKLSPTHMKIIVTILRAYKSPFAMLPRFWFIFQKPALKPFLVFLPLRDSIVIFWSWANQSGFSAKLDQRAGETQKISN